MAIMNYLSYNTLLQMRNTMSTDLDFKEDKRGRKLYKGDIIEINDNQYTIC